MKIFLTLVLVVILVGCQKEKTVIGVVDETKLITSEEIKTLGWKGFIDKYLGKVVTFKNLKNQLMK